jgi:hypothetical protein
VSSAPTSRRAALHRPEDPRRQRLERLQRVCRPHHRPAARGEDQRVAAHRREHRPGGLERAQRRADLVDHPEPGPQVQDAVPRPAALGPDQDLDVAQRDVALGQVDLGPIVAADGDAADPVRGGGHGRDGHDPVRVGGQHHQARVRRALERGAELVVVSHERDLGRGRPGLGHREHHGGGVSAADDRNALVDEPGVAHAPS